jgi:hypothetical protein
MPWPPSPATWSQSAAPTPYEACPTRSDPSSSGDLPGHPARPRAPAALCGGTYGGKNGRHHGFARELSTRCPGSRPPAHRVRRSVPALRIECKSIESASSSPFRRARPPRKARLARWLFPAAETRSVRSMHSTNGLRCPGSPTGLPARAGAVGSTLGRLHRVDREAAGQGDWSRSGPVLRTLAPRLPVVLSDRSRLRKYLEELPSGLLGGPASLKSPANRD